MANFNPSIDALKESLNHQKESIFWRKAAEKIDKNTGKPLPKSEFTNVTVQGVTCTVVIPGRIVSKKRFGLTSLKGEDGNAIYVAFDAEDGSVRSEIEWV